MEGKMKYDWLKSGIVTGLIFAVVTIWNGGKANQQLDTLSDWKNKHEAWSDKRVEELNQARTEIQIFKLQVQQLSDQLKELNENVKELNKRMSKK